MPRAAMISPTPRGGVHHDPLINQFGGPTYNSVLCCHTYIYVYAHINGKQKIMDR